MEDAGSNNKSTKQQAAKPEKPAAGITAIATIAALVITAINGYIAYIGWDSVKDINEIAEKVKKKQQGIETVLEGSYFLYARALEREMSELVTEMPGIEFIDPVTKKIKEDIRKSKENLISLETNINEKNRLTTRHLIDGVIAIDSKDCVGAIKSLNKFKKEIAVKYHLLGIAYAMCNDFTQSDASYARVVELVPYKSADRLKAKSFNNLANNDVKRERYDEAIRRYNAAQKLDPTNYGIQYNIAAVYSLKGNYIESLKSLCIFAKHHGASVSSEIIVDEDFNNLRSYLSRSGDWKTVLNKKMLQCE